MDAKAELPLARDRSGLGSLRAASERLLGIRRCREDTWVQEGTVGKVLDNPGSFGGVEAVPYYRLYNNATRWHHWTSDANEYYTLAQFPWWSAEGVDGYILPTQATGTVPLYRLLYPFIPGLHHWTIDPNEYDTLLGQYGWLGEGGSGFVIP